MRHAAALIASLALIGCTAPEPPDYVAELSAAAGVAATVDAAPPTPQPTPEGECTNCGGTGKLGDGTVSVPCPVCGGDGVLSGPTPSTVTAPVAEAEAGTPTPPTVSFAASYQAAVAESARTGKPILLIVSSDNCSACETLKTHLYEREVADYVESNYVPYIENASVAGNRWRVRLYPTQIVFKDGREVQRRQGVANSAASYLEVLKTDLAKALEPS